PNPTNTLTPPLFSLSPSTPLQRTNTSLSSLPLPNPPTQKLCPSLPPLLPLQLTTHPNPPETQNLILAPLNNSLSPDPHTTTNKRTNPLSLSIPSPALPSPLLPCVPSWCWTFSPPPPTRHASDTPPGAFSMPLATQTTSASLSTSAAARSSSQTNPRLCLDQIYSLVTSANLSSVSETDVSTFSNGQRLLVECADRWGWGRGGEVYELPAQVTASPHYGTFLITVGPVPSPLLASVNAFYISYRKATHNVTQYEETCSNQGWSVEEFTPKTSANGVFELQLSGLESATRYAVYVKAFSLTPGGTVVQSAIKYAFTSPFNPSQPVGLGWASPKSSELELWWSKPLYPNGAVDHYLVTLVMVPRASTISRDFCSPSVDVTLKSIAQRAEEKQDSYIKMRKQRWEEELASSKAPEANTCSVPPRVIYTRSQRKLQSKADAQEPPFQDAHLGSFVSGKDAQWNSDVFQASLTGGNSGPLLLPVGLRRTSNNFTKIVDG
ncbi:hypothetical protein C7M84_001807, partial [Penaeus vannamei]